MRGRLLHATTDWRFLCRPISFDTCSAAAVGRQGRWTQRLFALARHGGGRWKNSTATVARTEHARREGAASVARTERTRREEEGAASQLCEEAHRGGDVRARHSAGGGSTVEETCARDSAQAADVRSQRAWCGGEGDCARKRAGSSAEEEHICVEERAFRAHGEVDE